MSDQPDTVHDLCLRLANTAMRLADSLAEIPDDPQASAEWIQALGDAEYALDTALGIGADALLPPASKGTYSTAIIVGSGPRPSLVLEDDQPAPTGDSCDECGYAHRGKRCRAVFEEHGGDRVCECDLYVAPVQRYSSFWTIHGTARQCQICGSTCWPESTDPAWSARMEHGASCPVGECERLHEALTKLNAVRDHVIRTQRAGWSTVIYPLVEILDAAGFASTVTDEELEHAPLGNRPDGSVHT